MSAPRKTAPGRLSRRDFLRTGSFGLSGAVAGGLAACGSSDGVGGRGPADGENVFRHGVASGDPLHDRVILWTRVSGVSGGSAGVTVELARDPDFAQPATQRQGVAAPERDYTVKLDVDGLEPGTTYYYRFSSLGFVSPVGRTRTAPVGGVERLRLGVASCSSLAHGWFNAYRLLARRADIDCVLHLGDYIYEYGTGYYGNVREYEPPVEIVTLEDYRTRYGQYRSDADCQELHRQHPMIAVWDDHESADNSYRDNAKNHTEARDDDPGEGCWVQRKAWAIQAWREWMPVRDNLPDYIAPDSCGDTRDPARIEAQERIWRHFAFGDLVDLVMLDARLYDRDIARRPNVIPPAGSGNGENDIQDAGIFAACAPPFDGDHRLLGPVQEDWLLQRLEQSTARWKLIGQQIMFAQLQLLGLPQAVCGLPSSADVTALLDGISGDGPLGAILSQVLHALPTISVSSLSLNADQWDGFPAARRRVLDFIAERGVDNVVVLSGDIHTSWANDLTPDPNSLLGYNALTGEGSRAVEFVCTSVTSPGLDALDGIADALRLNNPHMKYIDLARRGYMVLDISAERCQGEWYYVDTVLEPDNDGESFGRAFHTRDGENRMRAADGPAEPPAAPPPLAP